MTLIFKSMSYSCMEIIRLKFPMIYFTQKNILNTLIMMKNILNTIY